MEPSQLPPSRVNSSPLRYLDTIEFRRPECAEFFDELPLWSAPFGLMILARAPVRPGLQILDLAAGTGFLSVELAQRCGPGSQVTAVDPWTEALDRLQKRVDYLHLENVTILPIDAATLSLESESIDLIVSNLGINNFEQPEAILAVCRRLLKRSGLLILTTNTVGHMQEFYELFRESLVSLGQTDRLPILDAHIAHRGSVESVSALLERSGFKVLHISKDNLPMRFSSGTALFTHYFIRLGFMGGWRSIPRGEAVEVTFRDLENRLNAYAERNGQLSLTVPMVCIEAQRDDE